MLSKKLTGQQFILEIKNFISTVNFVSHNTFVLWEINELRGLFIQELIIDLKRFNEI